MASATKKLSDRFAIWKTQHLTNHQFLMFLSALIGFIAGLVAVTIKNLTHYIQQLLEGEFVINYHAAFYFIFPVIGLAITLLIIKFGLKKSIGNGIPTTLHAISKRKGIMQKFQMYASLLTAPITVGFGGSVGLEAPTVATGASISSNLSRFFKMNQASRTLLIGCAAAGAMSALFKAPIAAIIFAIEIFSLDLTLISMIPLLLASVSAILTTYFFSGSDIILNTQLTDEFEIQQVPFYILLGVIASLCSIYFTKIYFRINKFFSKITSSFNKLLIGGISLGILIFLIPPLYGEGYDVINNLLQENYLAALGTNIFDAYLDNIWVVIALLAGLIVFKIIATSLTMGAGGVGGIFAPVLFMGSAMGHCFALIINNSGFLKSPLSVSNFTMVGMAGLMAGIMHAPLTAIFLIAELTSGYDLFVPLMITAAISFMITSQFQPHSVYTLDLASRGELITHNKDQMVLTLLNIRQVIETNFVSLNIDATLGDIIHNGVIKSSRNFFPVLDENDHIMGIILLDDIRPVMFNQSLYDEIKVRELMQAAPEVIDLRKDSTKDIMRKFQESDAWNLPVVDNEKYIGFISKSKLLTAYRQKLIEVTV
ncbi:chloride channel protein [Gillisia limnaea]|uniref:Cl-channel voltage-gated family protein n=1 Tax=Gillisia limnaea (strain DSM 15749 / LMG 21470 / R-8282) TaxID=865937 RepID=H2BWR4_GILLR|nr:chloride channel protein [Gillisia limnaea]EHQ03042.1 Cl- channel voltage-gated family protein [Gillisia limnaea DSM 15749]